MNEVQQQGADPKNDRIPNLHQMYTHTHTHTVHSPKVFMGKIINQVSTNFKSWKLFIIYFLIIIVLSYRSKLQQLKDF